jgi:hypothetical protein
MPPHCDTLDGVVVKAARAALETGRVNLILPYLPAAAEPELKAAFDKTLKARSLGDGAKDVADYWFFETAVRLHRQGEGAPYTGLKPAGLDPGPAVRKAEESLESGDMGQIKAALTQTLERELQTRFDQAMSRKNYDEDDVAAARAYVDAMLGFIVYCHHLHQAMIVKTGHARAEVHEKRSAA